MTVFLMLVTDSMPPNSDSLPLIGMSIFIEISVIIIIDLGIYYFSAIIIVSIATAMSVASLNIYHHGKHHPHPVPKWIARLFFIIIPKLLFMNIQLPYRWKNRRESILKCMVTYLFIGENLHFYHFRRLGKYTIISTESSRQEKTYETINSPFIDEKYFTTQW